MYALITHTHHDATIQHAEQRHGIIQSMTGKHTRIRTNKQTYAPGRTHTHTITYIITGKQVTHTH